MNSVKQSPECVYLDYAGACPVRDFILDAHGERCRRYVANPHASSHFSNDAKNALLLARRDILDCLGIPADTADVVWTSGGTEADNLITTGILTGADAAVCLVDAGAHPALLEPCRCSVSGDRCIPIPLHGDGSLNLAALNADRVRAAALLAVCHVNNETGAVHDLEQLRAWMVEHTPRARLAVDAVQSFGKIDIPWATARIDLLALSARKLGGPAGIGAAVLRSGSRLTPILHGGGQQGGVRPGTVDVVGAIEMALAARMACDGMAAEYRRLTALNQYLCRCCEQIPALGIRVLSPAHASPHIVTLVVPGYEGAILMRLLADRNVLVATGSACSAESGQTSHVLQAMGIRDSVARGVLRVSFGYGTEQAHIDAFIRELQAVVRDY